MRNLKKLVAFIVTLAMIATFAIPAFAAAPADVVGEDCEGAVTRLTALGVINGYTDGTFRPENSITRAEVAKLIIVALGHKDLAATAAGVTKFSDVAATHWATGYINLAVDLKIIKGNTDGTFAPEAPVLYEQAIAMIIRALGAGEKAEAEGGYPLGYLILAKKLAVTSGVTGVAGQAANRGIVAMLLDNSKTVAFYEKTGDTTYTQPAQPAAENFLERLGMDLKGDDVIVTQTPESAGLDANTFVASGTTYTAVDGTVDVESLLGKKVDLWGSANDGIVLAENVVGTELSVASLVYADATVTVTLADGTTADYTIADGAGAVETLKIGTAVAAIEALNGVVADKVDITLTVNGDAQIQFVEANIYDSADVFASITLNNVAKWTKFNMDNGFKYLRNADVAISNIVVVKDGETIEPSELVAGGVLFVAENDAGATDTDTYVVKATDETVTGTLQAAKPSLTDATSYKVDGTWYSVSSFKTDFDVSGIVGTEVTLTLDPAGKVFDVDATTAAASASNYGIILGNDYTEATFVSDAVYRIKVLTSAGDEVIKEVDADVTAVQVADGALANKLATYTVNADGIVDGITLADETDVSGTFDTTRLELGTTEVSSDVVIFFNGDVVALADVEDETAATATATIKDGTVIVAMDMTTLDTTVVSGAAYAYVTDVVFTADGYTASVINLDGAGEFNSADTTVTNTGSIVSYKLDSSNNMVDVDLVTAVDTGDDEVDAVTALNITVNGVKYWYASDVVVVDEANAAAMATADLYADMIVEVYLNADGDVAAIVVTAM